MNKLDQLLHRLCPNGVEYKTLSNTCAISRGVRVIKNQLTDYGKYPVYQNSMTPLGYYDKSNCAPNTAFIISAGAAGEIGYSANEFWAADDCLYFQCPQNLQSRFLYFALLCQQDYLFSRVRKASVPRLSRTVVEQLRIPVPPLPVQAEIVRILDDYTVLTAELNEKLAAELTARKRQYEYYRCKLLRLKVFPLIPLKEMATFKYGYTDKAKDYGNARFIRITDILDNGCLNAEGAKYVDMNSENENYLLSKDDILMARTGATFGKTLCVPNNEPAVYASFLIKIQLDNSRILNRYYWHFAQSSFYWEQANKLVSSGGQPQFNTNAIGRVKVPVPPLEEQKRIISILDRFDKLCNDISEGLPAEIAARQKRYEYYRDKLLTFKELTGEN